MYDSIHSFIVLALIILLIIVTVYLLKKTMTVGLAGNQCIKVMNQISVGSKERLLLLEVNKETLLIGVTPQAISTLHVFAKRPEEPHS